MLKTLPLLLLIQTALYSKSFSQSSNQVRANLSAFNVNGTASLSDGNLTQYNASNSNDIDAMDAVKLSNFGENFGLLRGITTLAIERRQYFTSADTIFFNMWNMRKQKYRLDLFLKGLEQPDITGVLEDRYLHTKTQLNLNGANSAVFSVTNDTASFASGRFRVIFALSSSAFNVLPITFTSVKAYQQNTGINVEWSAENEKDGVQYIIYTSLNGQQFMPAATLNRNDKSHLGYRWIDISPKTGHHFYRIASVDVNGKKVYSDVLKVYNGEQNNAVSVYPNPVINGRLNLQITDQPGGIYTARLMNSRAQTVYTVRLPHAGGSSVQIVQAGKNLAKGNYVLELITPRKNTVRCKVLLQ